MRGDSGEVKSVNYIYIKFSNQTQGEKAHFVLKRHRIASRLKRNPNPNHKEGCNYALFVDGDIFKAFEIISENHIQNMGIERYGDGR